MVGLKRAFKYLHDVGQLIENADLSRGCVKPVLAPHLLQDLADRGHTGKEGRLRCHGSGVQYPPRQNEYCTTGHQMLARRANLPGMALHV